MVTETREGNLTSSNEFSYITPLSNVAFNILVSELVSPCINDEVDVAVDFLSSILISESSASRQPCTHIGAWLQFKVFASDISLIDETTVGPAMKLISYVSCWWWFLTAIVCCFVNGLGISTRWMLCKWEWREGENLICVVHTCPQQYSVDLGQEWVAFVLIHTFNDTPMLVHMADCVML